MSTQESTYRIPAVVLGISLWFPPHCRDKVTADLRCTVFFWLWYHPPDSQSTLGRNAGRYHICHLMQPESDTTFFSGESHTCVMLLLGWGFSLVGKGTQAEKVHLSCLNFISDKDILPLKGILSSEFNYPAFFSDHLAQPFNVSASGPAIHCAACLGQLGIIIWVSLGCKTALRSCTALPF